MSFPANPEDRAELDRLQQQLAARQSTVHFARSGVAFLLSIMLSGAAGKIAWDAHRWILVVLSFVVAGLAIGVVTYAVAQYRFGKRVLKVELERFAALEALRKRLKLDDPSALLPG